MVEDTAVETEYGPERDARPGPRELSSPIRDRRLVRAAALGDAEAWDELVEAHVQQVWTALRTAGLEPDEAGATCELVWVRLAQALPDLGGEPLTSWLPRAAAQEALQAHARAGRTAAHQRWHTDRRRAAREGCG